MNVCMWLITNWRGQCCHRWHYCCYMGSFRSFVARDVSSLIRDISDWWRDYVVEQKYARGRRGQGLNVGKWSGDWCQLEVWRMTHLMVDAFKAGGQPIKPHQLWGEITEMEIKYCLLLPLHIGAATLARVIGWRLCALCQWIAPLDFNQESIREGSQSRITNKSTSNGY